MTTREIAATSRRTLSNHPVPSANLGRSCLFTFWKHMDYRMRLMDSKSRKPATGTPPTTPAPAGATNAAPGGASTEPDVQAQTPVPNDETKAQDLVPGAEVIGRG